MTKKEYNTRLASDCVYFDVSEFRCPCGECDGYPAYLNSKLLVRLDDLRKNFGKPVIITSGLRCKKYNNSLAGSSSKSKHMTGKAVDIYIDGVHPSKIHKYWQKRGYGYSYYGTSNMGSACHIQKGW